MIAVYNVAVVFLTCLVSHLYGRSRRGRGLPVNARTMVLAGLAGLAVDGPLLALPLVVSLARQAGWSEALKAQVVIAVLSVAPLAVIVFSNWLARVDGPAGKPKPMKSLADEW
jgi:hypothetical protein